MNTSNSSNSFMTIRMFSFLESLHSRGAIEDYTDDGWVLVHNEWKPIETFVNNEGDGVKNEYLSVRQ